MHHSPTEHFFKAVPAASLADDCPYPGSVILQSVNWLTDPANSAISFAVAGELRLTSGVVVPSGQGLHLSAGSDDASL
jgi:hypothetical protein